ncbi:thioredoxin family protein [Flagellimonas sp. S174]|uniref:thioredoxin family protein n=1 Tax=Flagellimonas sp. S174 TaxID=3410790 RepID=UPI003BF4D8C5
MRSIFTLFSQTSLLLLLVSGFHAQAQSVEWISWEEAVQLTQNETNPKKIFVDVYTDWCGWCKKMDKDTFQNPEVAAYMQDNFYMVKFDAEGKDPIEYQGKTFKYVPSGRRGYHELAAALLQGKMSYPTVVFLDEKLNMLSPVPGYQKAKPFLKIARYFGDNIYKNQDWKEYDKASK